ncbi:MAG: N-hydroxyarylamine O-acetyltransferase [Trebouxia sp. A1-2]|nr:MAG: N-hydroxyarylamine O-acetyltransferase [Trebouxia sp. A1-2]
MHLAHVQNIPYENLSLHLTKAKEQFPVIRIQNDNLFRKLVQHGRGGYCFEQNLLFAAALKACGFSLYLLQIRTLKGPATPVPDALRVHMAVGVVLDGVHWHCDVGYGGKGLRLPIRNDLVQTSKGGKFASVSNKEDKSYTESKLCSELYKGVQDTPEGRHTYDGKEFKVFKGTKLGWSKRPESEDEVYFHLKQLFNLNLDAA